MRRLQHLEIGVIDLDGPASKRPRNIAVPRFNNGDVPPCHGKRREDQREEQRNPGEK
ncbi:hypothetical protein [Sorangium sp. So ce1335]|uniref:hypothetical protein n=1 Tax=Sorangium sp. So ce1335 TaxID=3133335 RepID=UPI003F62012D